MTNDDIKNLALAHSEYAMPSPTKVVADAYLAQLSRLSDLEANLSKATKVVDAARKLFTVDRPFENMCKLRVALLEMEVGNDKRT